MPGFYAVGDEDTFLVSMDGQVFEVVRGGMAGPILARVDALPPGVPHELMDGRIVLPSVLLQAARVLDAPSPLRDLAEDALDVLDEVLWGGPVGVDVAHVDRLRREGLLVIEEDRAVLSPPLPAPSRRALHDDLRASLRRVGGRRGGRVTPIASSPRRSSGPGPRPSSPSATAPSFAAEPEAALGVINPRTRRARRLCRAR